MHHLLKTWFTWVLTGGYTGIIVLMAMESSIFPVPSEIVIPPAAFLAAQGKTQFRGRGAGRHGRIEIFSPSCIRQHHSACNAAP